MELHRYELTDGEAMARKHPDSFEMPERRDRDNLQPGDAAKLIFDNAERMWVEVEGRDDEGGYVGRLDNDPVVVPLSCGDVVRFGPEHVIEIMTLREVEAMRDARATPARA